MALIVQKTVANSADSLKPVKRRKRQAAEPQKALLIGGLALIVAVIGFTIFWPSSNDEELRPHPSQAAQASQPPASELQPNPAGAQANSAVNPRVNRAAFVDVALENGSREVQIIANQSVNSPADIDGYIQTISAFFTHAQPAARAEAYKSLLGLQDKLAQRLPKLIETAKGAQLAQFACLANEMKNVASAPALIQRLDAGEFSGQYEMFSALASFEDPVARSYVTSAMKRHAILRPATIWDALGATMSPEQAMLALETAAAGGDSALLAAAALGRYAATSDRAEPLVRKITPLLERKSGQAKIALVTVLGMLNPSDTEFVLNAEMGDPNPQVRAAATYALARHPRNAQKCLELLRTSSEPELKNAVLRGFSESPSTAVLDPVIELLENPEFKGIARRVLVNANNGNDLGQYNFVWKNWLKQRLLAEAKAAGTPITSTGPRPEDFPVPE